MKFLSRQLSASQLVLIGIVVPALLLLLVGGLQWESGNDFRNSRERVSHVRTVLLDLETLLVCMVDAETGQRGYLLVHEDSYLEPYRHSLAFSRDQIQTLRQLIRDPEQQRNLGRLEPLLKSKFEELAQTISLEQRGDHAGALKIMTLNSGKNTMDEIRATVRAMQDGETALYQQQEEAFQRNSQINYELSALLLALGFGGVIAVIYFSMLRRLEQMKEMITICAWSKLIEFEGEWLSVEQYLTRRLHARVTHGISRVESEKMLNLLKSQSLR